MISAVPIINDSAHMHLTLADWESLHFSHIALDALNLLVKSTLLIPESASVIFFDTRVRNCHKVSKASILSSPFDGQKIPITPEKLQVLFQALSEKYPTQKFIWIDDNSTDNKSYHFSAKAGQDALQSILYDSPKPCHCYTCENFTKEYLQHLDYVGVSLGLRLRILHNLAVFAMENQNGTLKTHPISSIIQ